MSDRDKSHNENKKTKKTDSSLLDITAPASTTDFTGLIPALPTSPDEITSYRELYPFLPASIAQKLEEAEQK